MTFVALALIAYCVYRELTWRSERKELLQRLQAPHQAIAEATPKPKRKTPPPIPVDSDEAWKELNESRG